MNRIQKAFGEIRAEEALKSGTISFLQQEIARRERRKKPIWAYAVACAVLLLLVGGGVLYWLYHTPVSYISIDVNPSVELELNMFDRVIDCQSYNDDGEAILNGLELDNMTYTQAIESILAEESMQSYLGSENAELVFTVSSEKEDEITAGIESCRGYAEHQGNCVSAQSGSVEEAHEAGLSVGRYTVYQQLLESGYEITPEECRGMSMRELYDLLEQQTQEDSSQSPQPDKDSTASLPEHQGQGEGNGYQWGKQNGQHHS